MNDTVFAFMLTITAGLATAVGGLIVLFSKVTDKKFLSICLSFSAGVMLYVAFAEIFGEAMESLKSQYGGQQGYLIGTLAFFGGIILMAVIDRFIPHDDHDDNVLGLMDNGNGDTAPSDISDTPKETRESQEAKELKRTGILSAIAIAIHNFPEGIMTFMAAMYDPTLGIAIAIAIIIHNIPEGIAMAAPIYYATGNRKKAFLVSVGAGLAEPLGALIAWLFIQRIFGDVGGIFGIPFAVVGGIMVFVAVHKLLPAAQKYGKHHVVMKWLFLGMGIMALSLVILGYVL
ncbi:MAG: zinc transporter ZupT [Defluviitaleaceae bacterium]|nr:zinc transporter ZupT [Defluviitaleaceae bacterium]